jgi:hypothetical protein
MKLNLIWNTFFAQTFSQLALEANGEIIYKLQMNYLIQAVSTVTILSYLKPSIL